MINNELPLSWPNISINEYIDLQNLLLDNEEGLEREDQLMQELQILYGVNPLSLDMPTFKKYVESLKFMAQPIPKMKIKNEYLIDGKWYTLHKQLNEFKVGQYIDYQQIMNEKKGVEAYAEFIALFLIPNGCEYNEGYDIAKAVKDIGNYMSIADAMAIAAFFLKYCRLYTALSLLYSQRKATKTIKDRSKRKEMKAKTKRLLRLILGE